MSSYLVLYDDPKNHNGHIDPMLDEYTYGDHKLNGKILRDKIKQGDFLFFHTMRKGKRVITAYYVVEQVLPVPQAKANKLIMTKYRNPHLLESNNVENETIVFGNPITSNILRKPVELTIELLNKLSRKPNLNPSQTETAAITSALRQWKKLSDADVELLLSYIEAGQEIGILKDSYLSSDEIEQLDESDVETFIAANPGVISEGAKLFRQQLVLSDGNRLDLLLKNPDESFIVVEIKKGELGKEVYKQIHDYIKTVKSDFSCNKVTGVIIGSRIMPIYEDFYADIIQKKELKVFLYAWKFSLRPYPGD